MLKRLLSALFTLMVLAAVLTSTASAWFVGADAVGVGLPTLDRSLASEDNITFVDPIEVGGYSNEIRPYATSNTWSFPVFSTVEEAADYYKQCVKNRSEFGYRISVNLPFDMDTWVNYASQYYDMVCAAAREHNGKPDEGDYLRQDGGAYLSVHYIGSLITEIVVYSDLDEYPYYSTAAQEKQVGPAIDSLISSLDLGGKSDYEKIKAVYEWMITSIRYDYENLNDSTYLTKHGAYAAIIDRTAVCSGYALLFYRIMLTLGIDCRYLTGHTEAGKAASSHAWNIVQLEGKYYLIDATWEACYYFDYQDLGILWTGRNWFLKGTNSADFAGRVYDDSFVDADFWKQYELSICDYNAHDTELVDAADADCTHRGYTGDLVCRVCGEVVEKGEVIPAPGHQYGDDDICDVCGFDKSAVLPGDLNGDGKINSTDSVLLLRYLAGFEDSGVIIEAADFNEDGNTNSLDSVLLLRKLAGLE